MITITINNKILLVNKGNSVLQVCEYLKEDIPRFCYHKELFVAGNCRMCLVEIEKFPKPIVSCSMPAGDNMIIYTNTPLVRKARESVLEFLLVNHPLDCPICDQGGECDLQDQTFLYGSDRTRFYRKNKRVVEDKYFNAIIKTVMTRCIQCTRCVRFIEQIAGDGTLGTSGRGVSTEIGFYINHILKNELSGNIIDLCPVGALTSKPYAFLARPWDLTSYYSFDLNDATGANIKIDVFNNELVRISPKSCPHINDVWITDKARYYFDGLKTQQILSCFFKQTLTKKETSLNFFLLLNEINSYKKYKKIQFRFLCDNDLDLESLAFFQHLGYSLGVESIQSVSLSKNNYDFEFNYKFPNPFEMAETSDFILIISSNLRYEIPNLNIKIKKNITENITTIVYIGNFYKNIYPMQQYGLSTELLKQIAGGKHKICQQLIKAKNPQIFIGSHDNLKLISSLLNEIQFRFYTKKKKNIINVISQTSSLINQIDLGINVFKPKKTSDFVYFINMHKKYVPLFKELSSSKYSICHSFIGNEYTEKAKVILPYYNPFQKTGSYVNITDLRQQIKKIINPTKNYAIDFKDFFSILGTKILIRNLTFIQKLYKTKNYNYCFTNLNKKPCLKLIYEKQFLTFSIKNFYKTNLISSNSKIMTKLAKENKNIKNFI